MKDYGSYWLEQKRKGELFDFSLSNHVWCQSSSVNNCQVGDYLEIDVDRAKPFHEQHKILDASVVRKFGSSPISIRNAMISASSANPTALAVTQDLANRVDRGEQTHFKYEIEDNGVKHSWIYKRN